MILQPTILPQTTSQHVTSQRGTCAFLTTCPSRCADGDDAARERARLERGQARLKAAVVDQEWEAAVFALGRFVRGARVDGLAESLISPWNATEKARALEDERTAFEKRRQAFACWAGAVQSQKQRAQVDQLLRLARDADREWQACIDVLRPFTRAPLIDPDGLTSRRSGNP